MLCKKLLFLRKKLFHSIVPRAATQIQKDQYDKMKFTKLIFSTP